MSQIIVQVEHLHLSYKNVKAVQDVSFSIAEGQVLAGCHRRKWFRENFHYRMCGGIAKTGQRLRAGIR